MLLIIPTRGRAGRQVTFSNLTTSLRKRTVIVCPKRECATHEANHPQLLGVVAQPDDNWTIARKRRWIVTEYAKREKLERLVMLDDDLRFCTRRRDDPKRFSTSTPDEIESGFAEMEKMLTPDTPHAGLAARGGSINPRAQEGGWQEAKRMMYVLGYHVPTLLRETDPFRIETREDMETSLQLLVKGFPNVVNYSLLVDQKFSAAGGASLERDFSRADADARTLEESYPGLVRVVQKNDVGRGISEAARTRLEVVIQWQKALETGRQRRGVGVAGAQATPKRSRRG